MSELNFCVRVTGWTCDVTYEYEMRLKQALLSERRYIHTWNQNTMTTPHPHHQPSPLCPPPSSSPHLTSPPPTPVTLVNPPCDLANSSHCPAQPNPAPASRQSRPRRNFAPVSIFRFFTSSHFISRLCTGANGGVASHGGGYMYMEVFTCVMD